MALNENDKKALRVFTLTYGLNKDIKFALLESLGSSGDKIAQQMARLYNIKTMMETLTLSLPKINGMDQFPDDYLRMNQINAKAVKYLLSRGLLKEIPAILELDALELDTTPEDFASVADEFEEIYNKYVFFLDYLNRRRGMMEVQDVK